MSESKRRCPTCGESFGPPLVLCPRDASVLEGELEAPPDPLVGRIFGGRFAIKERLGEGGMGAVYRAEQLSIGREVALKVLHPSFAQRTDAAQRFAREARLLSRLHHPAVVTLFDFGQAETGELFLAMELLKGETLAARLDRGALPPAEAASLAQAIAEALAVAHAAGIIHRDLKPDNVWICAPDTDVGRVTADAGERIKVLDFGLARSVSVQTTTLTGPGTLFGTPLYMAPEVIAGKAVGPAADLYALGAILHEMLVGKQAFERESIEAIFAAHLFDAPPTLPPDLPRSLGEIVRRLLAKDPNERIGGANEVRAALVAALETMDARRSRTDQVVPALAIARESSVGSSTSPAPAWRDSSELPAPARRWPWALAVLVVAGVGATVLALTATSDGTPVGADAVAFERDASEETQLAAAEIVATQTIAAAPEIAPDIGPVPDTSPAADTRPAEDTTPAEVAAATITLTIVATPQGTVTIDGVNIGQTPTTHVMTSTPGQAVVRITRPGFRPFVRKVDRTADATIDARLQKAAPGGTVDGEGFIMPDTRP